MDCSDILASCERGVGVSFSGPVYPARHAFAEVSVGRRSQRLVVRPEREKRDG